MSRATGAIVSGEQGDHVASYRGDRVAGDNSDVAGRVGGKGVTMPLGQGDHVAAVRRLGRQRRHAARNRARQRRAKIEMPTVLLRAEKADRPGKLMLTATTHFPKAASIKAQV